MIKLNLKKPLTWYRKFIALSIITVSLSFLSCENDDQLIEIENEQNEVETNSEIDEKLLKYFDFKNAKIVPESKIIEARKARLAKRKVMRQSKSTSNASFNSDTFIKDSNEEFAKDTRDAVMSAQDLKNFRIIDQNTLNEINKKTKDGEVVYYYNQKFTQAASNIIYGHHKNNNPVRNIIRCVGLMVKNTHSKNVIVKVYEGSKKYAEKAWKNNASNDMFLYWDIKKVNKINEIVTENQLRYPDVNHIHKTEVPSFNWYNKNNESKMLSAKDIFGINDNKITTIDVREAYIAGQGREITNEIGFGVEWSITGKSSVGKWIFEAGIESTLALSFDYRHTWSRNYFNQTDKEVSSSVAFFVPNNRVPVNYAFRLHPASSVSSTKLTFGMESEPRGGIRTFNRTGRHTSTDTWRSQSSIVKPLIASWESIWHLFWNTGSKFKYTGGWQNAGLTKTNTTITYRDVNDIENVVTGIEIFKDNTHNEANILLRENVPFKNNINKVFSFTQDKIVSGSELVDFVEKNGYPKDMSVSEENTLVLQLHTYPGEVNGNSYMTLIDTNNIIAFYLIKKSDVALNKKIDINLSTPLFSSKGFNLSKVKSFGFNIHGNNDEELTFTSYLK